MSPARRRLVRRGRPGAPTARAGHDRRGRSRSGRRACRRGACSRSDSSTRRRAGRRRRSVSSAARDVLRVERVNLADDEPFAAGHRVGARRCRRRPARAPTSSARRSTTCCRCAASSSAPCTRRITAESATAAIARSCSRAGRAIRCCCAGASRTTSTGRPVLVFGASLSRRSHDVRDRILVEIRSPPTCLSRSAPPRRRARRSGVRALPRTRRDRTRTTRPAADVRREGALRARRRSAHASGLAARRRLRRLPTRPRRDAGRDRADGAAAVHAGRLARRSRCRRRCTATT